MTLTTRLVQAAGWALLVPVLVLVALPVLLYTAVLLWARQTVADAHSALARVALVRR